jgi:hypothetical protein
MIFNHPLYLHLFVLSWNIRLGDEINIWPLHTCSPLRLITRCRIFFLFYIHLAIQKDRYIQSPVPMLHTRKIMSKKKEFCCCFHTE